MEATVGPGGGPVNPRGRPPSPALAEACPQTLSFARPPPLRSVAPAAVTSVPGPALPVGRTGRGSTARPAVPGRDVDISGSADRPLGHNCCPAGVVDRWYARSSAMCDRPHTTVSDHKGRSSEDSALWIRFCEILDT